jgi:hypothetical protein
MTIESGVSLVFALALQLALAVAPGGPSLGDPTDRSATFLSQSEPPLKLEPSQISTDELKAEIDRLTASIKATNVKWPVGAVAGSYVGGVGLYFTVIFGLFVAFRIGFPLLAFIAVGVSSAALLIGSLAIGSTTAAAGREKREALIKEREDLQRLLDQSGSPAVPMVDSRLALPMVTIARL